VHHRGDRHGLRGSLRIDEYDVILGRRHRRGLVRRADLGQRERSAGRAVDRGTVHDPAHPIADRRAVDRWVRHGDAPYERRREPRRSVILVTHDVLGEPADRDQRSAIDHEASRRCG
jgi:hypothetical protein